VDKSCVCSGCTDRQRRGGLDDSDDWVVDDLSGLEMRKEKFVMRLKKDRNLIREEECRWFVAWSVG
jgi:hypothetical protein